MPAGASTAKRLGILLQGLEDIRGLLFTKEKRAQWEKEELEDAAERGMEWMDGSAPPGK